MNHDEISGRMKIYVSSIMSYADHITEDYLDKRYREINAAPLLADIVRHNVFAVQGDDGDSVDLIFPDEMDKAIEQDVRSAGPLVAACVLQDRTTPSKDALQEIAVSILMASRYVADRINNRLMTDNDKLVLASSASYVFGETLVHMINAMNQMHKEEKGSA